ncbi:glycosyltransferase family 2 protein [Pseudomonadota bacterium]
MSCLNIHDDPRIREFEDKRNGQKPVLSIVVVGYRAPALLSSCLNSLRAQSVSNFEVIIVDNGGSVVDDQWQVGLSAARIHLKKNYRQIISRNIGASICRSQVLFFLDDDSLLEANGVKEIVQLYATTNVIASRCRLFYRSNTMFNRLATHYDLGEEQLCGYLLESGLAIRTVVYIRFGGYDETLLPGGEYMYWLYNVGKNYGLDNVLYFPQVLIWTDYSRSLKHFIWKSWIYAKGIETIRIRFPEFIEYRDQIGARRAAKTPQFSTGIRLLNAIRKFLFRCGQRYYRLTVPKACR